LSGAAGTAFLFKGSFAFETPSFWGDDQSLRDMNARNSRRFLLQRIGLALLMASFLCAFVHVFVE
jgi:hypothetical protein